MFFSRFYNLIKAIFYLYIFFSELIKLFLRIIKENEKFKNKAVFFPFHFVKNALKKFNGHGIKYIIKSFSPSTFENYGY